MSEKKHLQGEWKLPEALCKSVAARYDKEDEPGQDIFPPQELVTFVQGGILKYQIFYLAIFKNDIVEWAVYPTMRELQNGVMFKGNWRTYKPGTKEEEQWKRDHAVHGSTLVTRYTKDICIFPSPRVAQDAYGYIFDNLRSKHQKRKAEVPLF